MPAQFLGQYAARGLSAQRSSQLLGKVRGLSCGRGMGIRNSAARSKTPDVGVAGNFRSIPRRKSNACRGDKATVPASRPRAIPGFFQRCDGLTSSTFYVVLSGG
jgi:hypothetical protein